MFNSATPHSPYFRNPQHNSSTTRYNHLSSRLYQSNSKIDDLKRSIIKIQGMIDKSLEMIKGGRVSVVNQPRQISRQRLSRSAIYLPRKHIISHQKVNRNLSPQRVVYRSFIPPISRSMINYVDENPHSRIVTMNNSPQRAVSVVYNSPPKIVAVNNSPQRVVYRNHSPINETSLTNHQIIAQGIQNLRSQNRSSTSRQKSPSLSPFSRVFLPPSQIIQRVPIRNSVVRVNHVTPPKQVRLVNHNNVQGSNLDKYRAKKKVLLTTNTQFNTPAKMQVLEELMIQDPQDIQKQLNTAPTKKLNTTPTKQLNTTATKKKHLTIDINKATQNKSIIRKDTPIYRMESDSLIVDDKSLRQFTLKMKKYILVEKYLCDEEIHRIYIEMLRNKIPEIRWTLYIVDEIYKKIKNTKPTKK